MAVVAAKLGEQVQAILVKRIAENSLVVPAPPTVVTRVLKVVGEATFSQKEAAPLVEGDTVVAARVVRAASDQQPGEAVNTLADALARLGAEPLREVLIEISTHRLFESRDARIGEHTRGLWQHSVAVALLARELADLGHVSAGEAAYLAGLLHDIGKPVVAFLLLEAEKSAISAKSAWIEPEAWLEVVQRVHRPIGVALARKWGLPSAVAAAIAECGAPRQDEGASVGNCVRLANALAKRAGLYVGSVDRAEVDTQVAAGLALLKLDDASVNTISEEVAQRARAMTSE